MQGGSRLARAAYVMFVLAVLLALLKLSGLSGAKPFFLKMVPTTPVAKAAQAAAGGREAPGGEALDLPDAYPRGIADRSSDIGSRTSNLPGRQDSARTRKPRSDEAPVFYRPSSGEDVDGETVCGNLGDFPESSRVVFPLPEDYFGSYEDTWGAARPQGGHEGTDLMSPTGTPEFAITDGTIVPVKGANENGWNRLGGYTVMLEAAHDAGPIQEGDLFYYAHMEEESALKLGTKVRAGQQIGVVGDTGEGSEATRGKFPPHLHFGWYDAGSADSRTNLESGAMNPYSLLLWLEEQGGSITGGMDASYCEAPLEEPVPNSSGTTPDLDTGDHNDAFPSPIVEQNRAGQDPPEHERKNTTEAKSEETDKKSKKSKETGATDDAKRASPADSSGKEDGAGDGFDERSTPDVDSITSPSTDEATESNPSQAEIRGEIRTFLEEPSQTDLDSRRSYIVGLVEHIHKAEKNQRYGWNVGVANEKKPKKRAKPPERKKLQKTRSFGEATRLNPKRVANNPPAPKKDREQSPDATGPEERKLAEGGSR